MNNLSYLIKQGIRSVWKNRFMSFASLCIMTVSLILVGMSAIVMLDCGIILDNVSDKNEISVYLNDDADIKHIGEVLKSNTLTEKVDFISAEEGLKKMIEQYSEQKELFDKYADCVREYQTITDCLLFQSSFKLGTRMMLEVMEE